MKDYFHPSKGTTEPLGNFWAGHRVQLTSRWRNWGCSVCDSPEVTGVFMHGLPGQFQLIWQSQVHCPSRGLHIRLRHNLHFDIHTISPLEIINTQVTAVTTFTRCMWWHLALREHRAQSHGSSLCTWKINPGETTSLERYTRGLQQIMLYILFLHQPPKHKQTRSDERFPTSGLWSTFPFLQRTDDPEDILLM